MLRGPAVLILDIILLDSGEQLWAYLRTLVVSCFSSSPSFLLYYITVIIIIITIISTVLSLETDTEVPEFNFDVNLVKPQ